MDKPNETQACFDWTVRVYWEDTDAGGIVFYANYLKFFERARTEWLRSLGVHQHELRQSQGGMFVVSETQVRYHRPATLDDQIVVRTRLLERGRASMLLEQTAHLARADVAPAGQLLCEGRIRIGWVDAVSVKPARMPAELSELFA